MPTPAKHRDPVVNAAVALFRRRGYSGTGVADIVEAACAPKGSLYHYFPGGKRALAAAAVDLAGQRVEQTLRQIADRTRGIAELLTEHARLLGTWLTESRFRDGCPITAVLVELAPDERSVTAAGREAYERRLAVLRERLISDGFEPSRAERLAVLCTSAIQGALVQARIERSPQPLMQTAEELGMLLRDASRRR